MALSRSRNRWAAEAVSEDHGSPTVKAGAGKLPSAEQPQGVPFRTESGRGAPAGRRQPREKQRWTDCRKSGGKSGEAPALSGRVEEEGGQLQEGDSARVCWHGRPPWQSRHVVAG